MYSFLPAIALACAILYANIINAASETLVLTDKSNQQTIKQTHSTFFRSLEDRGYKLIFKSADDNSVRLLKHGDLLYDNIILFCPEVDVFRGSLDVKEIVSFVDEGRDILLVGSNKPGAVINELAAEVGFEFKERPASKNYSKTKLTQIKHIVGDAAAYYGLVYSGTSLRMATSELTLEILTADEEPRDLLIGATQARNNARVLVSGSLDFFSDKAFEASKQANKKLADELTRWTFKEKAVLRFSDVTHKKVGETKQPDGYTIMDDIIYKIKIEQYENGEWSTYRGDDVQLEFIRIDPFVRTTMKQDGDYYVAQFKVPDVYGVYKLVVDYKHEGLTYIFSSTQVSVRPLKHNEYERYIYSAYPYYLSAFLMMVYLYLFSFVFVYYKEKDKNE
ncbi:Dolichyl-diphosphooligosaccharide--protein glycosyltransferase 48 kDa subunit, partial [Fragariocoptes setiger]